jgi:hypothetical protein
MCHKAKKKQTKEPKAQAKRREAAKRQKTV